MESSITEGMVIRYDDTEIPFEELKHYVSYLEEQGVIHFSTDICNGIIRALTDVKGQDVVALYFTMVEDVEELATTGIHFQPGMEQVHAVDGGHGMSSREERIQVFEDTMSWIKEDSDLSVSLIEAKNHTKVYYEDDYPAFDSSVRKDTVVTVTGHRSFEAAMLLNAENPGKKIAVMNFANAFHAGGGVTKGASAQEECLCRTSTLYPLINRTALRDTFYKHHKDINTPKATDSLIYTEGVIICKSDEDHPKRLPKENWVKVDVITIAAPDLRTASNVFFDLTDGGTSMNDAELFGYHVKRAIHMLTVAVARGADILVLGAFGCGAFRNDPEVVAQAYKAALQEFPHVFEKIEFAVYCRPGDMANFDAFQKYLG